MISLVIAAALAGVAAEPMATAAPAAATSTASPPAKSDKPKSGDLVCKKEAVVGTRLPSRICLTKEDWDLRRQDSKDELKKIQQGQPYQSN